MIGAHSSCNKIGQHMHVMNDDILLPFKNAPIWYRSAYAKAQWDHAEMVAQGHCGGVGVRESASGVETCTVGGTV